MNAAPVRGYGCLAVHVGIAVAALFGGWRLALTVGLVWLGGTMLIATIVVRPGPEIPHWMGDRVPTPPPVPPPRT